MPERTFIDARETIPTYRNPTTHRLQFDQQAQSRLQHLKAVLHAAGIEDLSSLGILSLYGNLSPTAGVSHPRLAVLFADPRPFQSAYMAHPQGGRSLVRIGGTAKLVNSMPLAASRMELAASTMLPVNTAYWAASWIDLADGTAVVLQYPVMSLVIIAEKISIGNNVTVTWERPLQAHLPGKPRKPLRPGTAPTATSIDKPPAGTPGVHGTPGDPSSVHFQGLDAPEIEIWTLEISGTPVVDLRGQDGFEGAPGGDGGDGGNGAPGKPDAVDFLGFCKSGPGDGGDGGPGGRAGDGGPGGDGGAGGRFTLNAPQTSLTNFAAAISINVDGGSAGPGGIPGIPGVGGVAGSRGNNSHGCKPATPRSAGSPGAQGAPGNRGSAGRPGVQVDQAVSLRQIDADAFTIEVSKPGIATLVPNPAKCGQQIEVTGKGFARGDSIRIGGITCPATVQSDTTLQFTLPKVPGGIQFAQLVRSDGTTSNPASVYVQPIIDASEAALRFVPGQKVRLQGSGFAPGMQVQVNNQDMPGVILIDAATVEFMLVRPTSVVQNPSGEVVSVKVVLADAGPDSASNSINLTLDTFRILAFGDSVMWGQGLEEPNKFHSLVEQAIRQRHGDIGVYKEVRAHSGATIVVPNGETASQNRLNGEVPTSFPVIFDQVPEFENAPAATRNDVDLILLDGGINDVNVQTIISPLTSTERLTSLVRTFCHNQMLILLTDLTKKFSNARIIVTGYYQIISHQSDLALLDVFMIALGFDLAAIPGAIIAGIATPEVRGKISDNCALFASEANRQLKMAVDEANAALGSGASARVFFADPKFGPANAALAPDSFLYGIHADLSPDDPPSVAGPRAIACDAAGSSQTNVPKCKRASVGHPNAKGAQAYANAILPLV